MWTTHWVGTASYKEGVGKHEFSQMSCKYYIAVKFNLNISKLLEGL